MLEPEPEPVVVTVAVAVTEYASSLRRQTSSARSASQRFEAARLALYPGAHRLVGGPVSQKPVSETRIRQLSVCRISFHPSSQGLYVVGNGNGNGLGLGTDREHELGFAARADR